MTTKMINTVTERVNEMLSNPAICQHYNSFKSKDAAQEWIIMAAIATLIGARSK